MAIDDDNVTVEGSVNAGWTSYAGDGETVGVSDADGDGEVTHEVLPADVDPEGLTDTQRQIIERAAVGSWESQTALAVAVGVSLQTVSRTLRTHAPDLNERVKMSQSECAAKGGTAAQDDQTGGATDAAVKTAVDEATDDETGDRMTDTSAASAGGDGMDRDRVETAVELCERFQFVLNDGAGQRALAQVQTELELALGEVAADDQ